MKTAQDDIDKPPKTMSDLPVKRYDRYRTKPAGQTVTGLAPLSRH